MSVIGYYAEASLAVDKKSGTDLERARTSGTFKYPQCLVPLFVFSAR
jgi:hypothetical protein